MEPVSLDANIPENQPVSIDPLAAGNPTPSAPVADIRSKKAAYGVGDILRKSEGEIRAMIMTGQEGQLRSEVSARLDAANEQKRMQYLTDTVTKSGRTLSLDQMEQLRKPPSDPDRVFEDGYARKLLEGIYGAETSMQDTGLQEVVHSLPEVHAKDFARAEDYSGNYEYARKRQEDMAQLYENQGWLPWLADQGKNIVPFYSDLKIRGWIKTQPAFDGWLQGNSLEDQTRTLLRLPPDQFKSKLDQILGKLSNDNPTLALQYANAVLGMSNTDVMLGNINNVIDITGLPGLTAASYRLLKSLNTTRVALKDGIKSANIANPTPATISEGFGDTATAAVKRASQNISDDLANTASPASNTLNVNTLNDPIRRAKEALPTGFILDKAEIAANPGPLSRELLNRIMQQQDVASKRIIDTIFDTAKVQRIPLEEATEAVMSNIKNEVRNQHPGIRNAIADIGDPVANPAGGNYNFPIKIFQPTGEQFANELEARRFAKQYGIQEFDVVGKPGAKYYIPEAAVKRPWETKTRLQEVTFKDGELKVKVDGGAEVEASLKPQAGHIPISVEANGKITFHPTLKDEGDVAKAVLDQQGLGFHLVTFKSLDESQTVIKDLMLQLESTKSIASKEGFFPWLNSLPGIGISKTSDNTLSPFEIHQRKTATYSISNYQKLLQDEMRFVEDVARGRIRVDPVTGEDINGIKSYLVSLNPANKIKASQMYKDFQRFLDFARDDLNPDTGKPGYFKRNPAEINEWYQTNLSRPPTFQEYQAYFAFTRNYENDRVFRSVREYANKARLGAEQHQITFRDATGNKFESGYFDGVSKKQLPGGDYPILVTTGGKVDIMMTSKIGGRYKTIAKEVEQGKSVVTELYNPELRPLKGIPGVGHNYIRYVVTDASERASKPLDWNQVNRLSGGHFEYDYEHSIKEAKMMRTQAGSTTIDRYEGDNLFSFVDNPEQGRRMIKVLNEVKKLLVAKNVNEAKIVFEEGIKGETGPAMPWKDFYARTKPTKDEKTGLVNPATININEPYYLVRKGSSIIDIDKGLENRYKGVRANGTPYDTFQDGTKSGSLARQYQVGYTQERDADNVMAFKDVGGKDNPIYKYYPARMVDPITTMNRALNQITSASFMDDMKIAGIEGWLREAEKYLKASESEVRANPWYHFKNSTSRDAFKKDADEVAVSNLLSNRFKTQQFIGIPSKWDIKMHDAADRLASEMYDKMGPKGSLVPTWLLTKTTSPIDIMKSMAYHAKLGLFAIPQILTQSQTLLTVAAFNPRSAPSAAYGLMLHDWSRFATNPEFMNTLDNYATKLHLPGFHRYRPGEWAETAAELDRRGFANVGGEYTLLNTQLKHQYIKGEAGDFLEKGQIPFKMTEQQVRIASWYSAAQDYRAANPGKKVLGRTDWDHILDKADDLSGNMSRASASVLQSGPLALTGQFLTYQMHLAEFFWSKRMDPMAKMRMYMTYSAMFGVPGGIGITGIPASEYVKKQLQEGNIPGLDPYVVGDNPVMDTIVQGLPAVFMAWATSPDGDTRKGNWYNISDKLGAGGFTQLRDAFYSDKSWLAFIGGASTSILSNTWNNSSGLRQATLGNWYNSIGSMMTGNEAEEAFPMRMEDWVDVFKEVTMVKNTWAASVAIQSGKWLSKNESYQQDVTPMNAIFMALSGLNMQEPADNYVVGQSIKDQQEKQKWALQKFILEFRRGITNAENDDFGNYKESMTRAFRYLKAMDYPIDKYASAISIASEGWEQRIGSIREEFYTKNVPAGKEEKYLDAYQRFIKRQENMK